jgi:hypothetical protein
MTLLNRLERLEARFASRASERAESDYALYNKVGRAAVATLSDADLTLLEDADPPDLSPEQQAAQHRLDAAFEASALKLTGRPFSELCRAAETALGLAEGSRGRKGRGRRPPLEQGTGSRNR